MNMIETTEELNKALDDMLQNSRAVNDSMNAMAKGGMEQLSNALQKAVMMGERTPTRQPEGQIIADELQKLLRQELVTSLGNIFAPMQSSERQGAASGMNIVINNNGNNSVTAQERVDAFNQRTLEITIDQMVADSLLRGRQTTGVMRSLFGLVPTLMGR